MKRDFPSSGHPNRKLYNWLVYDIIDDLLESHASLIRGKVLDLGAGSCAYKSFFLSLAEEYLSVDWGGGEQDIQVDVIANLNKPLPIADEVADLVVSLSVLEHLSSPEVMLSEASRLLRSDGAIILQVPWQWWVHEAPHDYYRYTPYRLRTLLEQAGFRSIEVIAQAGFFTTLALKINYFILRFVSGPGILKKCFRGLCSLIWYAGQKIAPHLDRLDRNWELETTGYFVTARKP